MISVRVYRVLFILSIVIIFLFADDDRSLEEAFLEYQDTDPKFEIAEIVYIPPEEGFVYESSQNEAFVLASDPNGLFRLYFCREKKRYLHNQWEFRAYSSYPILDDAEFLDKGICVKDFYGNKLVTKKVELLFLRSGVDSETVLDISNFEKVKTEFNSGGIRYAVWYNMVGTDM